MMKSITVAATLLWLSASQSFAVSDMVKHACQDDYFAYCSQHEVGSESLRNCMRGARKQLSKVCTAALAKSGEASKADIAKYKGEMR